MTSRYEPVFIGPERAGKSTLSVLIGQLLGCPVVKVDRIRWQYYERWGLTREESDRVRRSRGLPALLSLWKPLEIRLVEAALGDYLDCVFDFGAGFAMYSDPEQTERLRVALRPLKNVVLVLPSSDDEKSIEVLWSRTPEYAADRSRPDFVDYPRHDVEHPLPREVATIVLYTEERRPEDCAAELVARLQRP